MFVCWYIFCTNINCKVTWLFPRKKFDLVIHIFNRRTRKILHMHLTIFQWMWGIIPSNISDNAVTKGYHFLCLLWSITIPRGSNGSIVTEFLWRLILFVLFLNWCARAATTLLFFINFFIRWFCLQYFYHLRCYQ